MKTLIIEDELPTARNLTRLLSELMPDAEVLGILQSIDESVEYLKANPMPDLIFMDINLADGLSFCIFEKVRVTCPVIFTTAYDEYALKAFEVNSIDYLLKPLNRKSVQRALDKLESLTQSTRTDEETIRKMFETLSLGSNAYKSSFLVTAGTRLVPIKTSGIAYIYFENKNAVAVGYDGSRYNIGGQLDELSRQLDPKAFYRANRQFIIAKGAVTDITTWFGYRIVVNLCVPVPERIIVSRTHVQDFKKWLTE